MRVRFAAKFRSGAGALETVFSGPLRRSQISFAAMWAGESAFMVSLAVVAFRSGGVAAVGVVTGIRMATAALLTPFLATMADRVRRERMLTAIGLVRGAMLAGAAVVTGTGGPPVATYGFAVVATVALSLYRPAHSALLPALAHSPGDLTAANAVRGMLDSLATLGGPMVAAALLAVSGPSVVFATCSALSLLGGLVVVALRYDPPPRTNSPPGSAGRDVLEGFTTIARDPTLRLRLGLCQRPRSLAKNHRRMRRFRAHARCSGLPEAPRSSPTPHAARNQPTSSSRTDGISPLDTRSLPRSPERTSTVMIPRGVCCESGRPTPCWRDRPFLESQAPRRVTLPATAGTSFSPGI